MNTYDPDESVVAAQRWADLILADDLDGALQLTHPSVRDSLPAIAQGLSEDIREAFREWTWAYRSRPLTPGREVVRLVGPDGMAQLEAKYVAGEPDEQVWCDDTVEFIMEYTNDGRWLCCGQSDWVVPA
jgi:hypothetical protein